jgi:hypothetical protein
MVDRIKAWREARKRQEKLDEILLAKESVLFSIFKGRTTEESIEIFEDTERMFRANIERRLAEINNEKQAIQNFLNR